MTPKKHPKPRPVTAWLTFYPGGDPDVREATWHKLRKEQVRCRITPIRPPTDAEVERLARKLASGVYANAWGNLPGNARTLAIEFARAAFRMGARP